MSALMDSRPFVVFSDRPSTPYTPRRCNVRVSSRPSARLPAADWFRFLQLMLERLEGGEGLVVLRTVVGALETLPPHRLLTLGQVTHHVLALVPLTPLHQGAVAEGLPPGRPEPLAAIYDHQKPLGNIEAPLDQGPEERGQHLLVLGVRLDKAQEPFVPRHRDAQRDDHRRLGERLAVQCEAFLALRQEADLSVAAKNVQRGAERTWLAGGELAG